MVHEIDFDVDEFTWIEKELPQDQIPSHWKCPWCGFSEYLYLVEKENGYKRVACAGSNMHDRRVYGMWSMKFWNDYFSKISIIFFSAIIGFLLASVF